MPTFVFTSPDGREHEVTGPEGATEEQAFQMLQMQEGVATEIPKNEFDDRSMIQKAADYVSGIGESTDTGSTVYNNTIGTMAKSFVSPALSIYGFIRKNNFFEPEAVPALTRAGASIKTTPEGRAGFIESQLGNVNTDPLTGKPRVVIDGQNVPFNEPRTSVSDLAGLAGPAISLAPNAALAATGYGASPPAQAAASGVGTAMRHGVSALLPGGGENLGEAAIDVAKDTALTYGLAKGTGLVADAYNAARPTNIFSRTYAKGAKTPFGKEGARLQRETGVDLTPGRETGNISLVTAETKAKQTVGGRKFADEYYVRATEQSQKYLKSTINKLDPANLDVDGFGAKALATVKKATSKSFDARRAVADADYATFNNMPYGGPSIPRENFTRALNDATENFSGTRTAIKKGESLLKKSDLEQGTIGLKQMIDQRKILANAAEGKGKLFSNLDPGTDRVISQQLLDGINADMKYAEQVVGVDLGKELAKANKNWAINSQKIRDIQDTVVGRLFNKKIPPTPQEASTALLKLAQARSSDTTKLKNMVEIMDKTDPTFSMSYRAAIANDLLEKSNSIVPLNKYTSFSPETYVAKALELDKGAIGILFNKPAEKKAFFDGILVNLRLRGANPEMTGIISPEQMAKEGAMIAGSFLHGQQSSTFAAGFAVKWLTPKFISRQIFDKEGQMALKTLRVASPETSAYRNALGILSLRAIQENKLEEDTNQSIAENAGAMQQ